MPLPLAAMVAGVSALPGIVENSLKVVDSIKSRYVELVGLRVSNDEPHSRRPAR